MSTNSQSMEKKFSSEVDETTKQLFLGDISDASLKTILENSIDPNVRSFGKFGKTLLRRFWPDLNKIKLLLQYGANINACELDASSGKNVFGTLAHIIIANEDTELFRTFMVY